MSYDDRLQGLSKIKNKDVFVGPKSHRIKYIIDSESDSEIVYAETVKILFDFTCIR